MEPWKIQAILAALFAGFTSILAKSGMQTLGPDVSLALRTGVVFILVTVNAFAWTAGSPGAALAAARPRDLLLLALSGLTTSLSWIFYYRAMKTGTVSFVALVDKGSILVTLLLAFWLLREPFTAKMACGGGLILLGIMVLTWEIERSPVGIIKIIQSGGRHIKSWHMCINHGPIQIAIASESEITTTNPISMYLFWSMNATRSI